MVEIVRNSGLSVTTTTAASSTISTTTTTNIDAPAPPNESYNMQIWLLFFGLALISALACFILFKVYGKFSIIFKRCDSNAKFRKLSKRYILFESPYRPPTVPLPSPYRPFKTYFFYNN